jgi:hypothetical protein
VPVPARALLLAAAATVAAVLGGCGDDGRTETDPAATAQATERLVGYGLTDDQAECVVEELGADAVTEAPDLNALVEGQAYRDAVEGCVDDG